MLDDRAKKLLLSLIAQYIGQGQPVASKALIEHAGLELSSATVRNVMADLERMGLIVSPHTSAGRVPTPQGYRFFVDAMMMVGQYSSVEDDLLQAQLQPDTPQRLVASAASLLSQVSQFAGVISTPKRAEQQFFRQIEFLSLSAQRILVIVITPDGDVQNRLLSVAEPYSASQLVEAANYLNSHYAGIPLSQIQKTIKQELSHLQQRVADLMQAAISQPVQDATTQLEDALIVKGERHLLNVNELTSDMNRLRQTFHLFDEKTRLLQLLEQASTADGVQIFIGGESDVLPFDGVSIISAPYSENNQIIGTLGVIGPSRMAYDKMIPLVNVTAQILSRALSHTSTTTNIEY